jgi:hypothetical protein
VPTREATCHCGQLRLAVDGDPFVVSICNCRACQRRTGSAFGMQAAFNGNQAHLHYNVACCESLAGRTAEAVEHIRQAVDLWEGCRDMAKTDSDFDLIRDEPEFKSLVGR